MMWNSHPSCLFKLHEIISFAFREILQHKKEEKKALYRALMSEGNGSVCPVLRKILPFGMAYHHSGI
jgi:POLQ-like helicase